MNPIDGTAFQQALDVLAREAQALADARSCEGAVLDEPVHRRGVHLQVSCQVLDRDPSCISLRISIVACVMWITPLLIVRGSRPGRGARGGLGVASGSLLGRGGDRSGSQAVDVVP